ncbi:hypothetical protein [Rickettsia endosymbiont of Polydrusus tereticollis]|uniref:hypothetical protein n=1 Tax=Rickettsia endosymbiont of Polydrusus tereticollis TaxID=3066251 RepID=UPI003132F764
MGWLKKVVKAVTKPVVKLVDHVVPVTKLVDHIVPARGFFRNPLKATIGAVSKFVPGGKYLTGRETERQKFHYNNALNDYNSYASQAQSTIDNLNKQLYESAQRLQSIEQQKYQHGQNSYQLQSHVDEYQRGLQNLEQQKASLGSEANELQAAFEGFKNKAPSLTRILHEVRFKVRN